VTHDNWLAECNYALALESDGQPIDAMPHFLAAVRLNPQSAQAHFNYGGALQRRGDIADAIAEYRAAVDLYPLYSKASLAAGALLMKTDRFAAAADVFAAAAQHDPLFVPLFHCCRGADLLQHGRPTEAISEFEEALRTQPDYLLAHMGLGVALLKTGQAAAAVEQFQAAELLNPNDPAIKKNLAAALEAASTQSSNAIDRPPSTAATGR
jgi:tetratricopeptide (TPR) repeat protein